MTDENEEKEPTQALGAGVAIGAGLGAVLFAITDNPVWIALGIGIGVAIGAAFQQRQGGD